MTEDPILASFPWLSATPYKTKVLGWPKDVTEQVEEMWYENRYSHRTVLDDRLAVLAYPRQGGGTWVFYADLKDEDDQTNGEGTVTFQHITTLPGKIDMIALLPRPVSKDASLPEYATLQDEAGYVTASYPRPL
jgi:hypothetical protein